MTVTCERCGTPFAAVNRRARYCSGVCRAQAARDRAAGRTALADVDLDETTPGAVAEELEKWLTAHNVPDDPLTAAARRLAAAIDDPRQHAAALVSCSRQLQVMLPDLRRIAALQDEDITPLDRLMRERGVFRADPRRDRAVNSPREEAQR